MNVVATQVLSSGRSIRVARAQAQIKVNTERDARTMNNMDPETRAVHLRLERWGKETRQAAENGWPPSTMLGRMIEQGANGAAQAGQGPVSLSEEAQRTDAAVAKCCEIDQRALKEYYQTWSTIDMLAKRLSMRTRQAQNVLRRARWRVGAHIEAMAIAGGKAQE